MLAQILITFGAALWSFLGTIHIIYTFFSNKLEPRDAATTSAMKATSPVLTKCTNLWNGWIGFNAGFGMGLLLLGTTYLLLAVGFFFFNDTATTEIYTLSLHDALPI